eukprot:Skav216640  [mRNA]  locus=scaffold1255:166518:167948:+ [translate_table: standard]
MRAAMETITRLSPQTIGQIGSGYLFLDWFAIPQITSRKHGVNEGITRSDAALAVQSIPAYVEADGASDLFVALVPVPGRRLGELKEHRGSANFRYFGHWTLDIAHEQVIYDIIESEPLGK